LIFYGLEKAYDRVPKKYFGKPWEKQILISQLYKIIRNIYSNNTSRITIRSNLSNEFSNTKGLLQECPMSPALFKIYMDTALKEWSRKCKRMELNLNTIAMGKFTLCR
jgi:hypothetical protein